MDILTQVKNAILAPAQAYNNTHYYQSFEVTPESVSTILGDYAKDAVGWVTSVEGAGTGKDDATVEMDTTTFTDLYDPKTAQLAVETFFADQLFQQYQYFTKNKSQYNILPGLYYSVYRNASQTSDLFFQYPFVDPKLNPVLVTGNSDKFQSLATSVNTTNLSVHDQNSLLLFEWTGFFMTMDSGEYSFDIKSSQKVFCWIGNVALTDFQPSNVMFTNSGAKLTGKFVAAAGIYYPIRIKYACNGIQSSLSIAVSKNGQLVNHGEGLLFTITDTTGQVYEPIQIHYSLSQITPESVSAGLYNLAITKFNVINNYEHNHKLRKALSNFNGNYTSTVIASCNGGGSSSARLELKPSGNLELTNDFTVTNIVLIPQQDTYSRCVGGSKFSSAPQLTMNSVPINQYYTVQETTQSDEATGIRYTAYNFTNFQYSGDNTSSLSSVVQGLQQNPSNNAVINADSVLGNETVTTTISQPLSQPVQVTNLSKLKDCQFKLQLTTTGNLVLSNGNRVLWELFQSSSYSSVASQVQAGIQNAIVNTEWLREYQASKQSGRDMQYLDMGVTLYSSHPLISSNGKCKLTVDNNNNLVLMTTTQINKSRNYTNATDPPNVFYLFNTKGDMKLGKHFLVDTNEQTLQYVPINSDIFNYTNTYKPQVAHPPNTDNVRYLTKKLLNNAECKQLCDNTKGCGYYYTYKGNDGAESCIINTDNSPPMYLPTPVNSTIQQSVLNIRDKVIDSSCNVNGYLPRYNVGISTDQYMSFQSYQVNMTPYTPTRDKEGACGDPTISKNLNIFQGKEPYRAREISSVLEPFVPGYKENACQTLDSSQCVQELTSNIRAISDYSVNIRNDNTKIDELYHKLNNKIGVEYQRLRKQVNENPNYDAIDANGNLLSNKNSMLGAMIQDTKDRMLSENNAYIFANLALATSIVAFLAFTPE